MNKHFAICLAALIGTVALSARVREGNFQRKGGNPPNDAAIEQYRKSGITCPDAKEWTPFWHCIGKDGSVEFPREQHGNRFARISGNNMLFCGTDYGKLANTEYIAFTLDVRGKGTLYISYLNYLKKEAKNGPNAKATMGTAAIEVDSTDWTNYLFVMKRPDVIESVHPALMALKGTVDIDNVNLIYGEEHTDIYAIGEGEAESRLRKLHKTDGALEIELDEEVQKRIEIYRTQDSVLQEFVEKNPENQLAAKLLKHSNEIRPYLLTEGLKTIRRNNLNRAMALSYAIQKLTGIKVDLGVKATADTQKKKLTIPSEKKEKVLFQVTNINPGKILYEENDDAEVSFYVRNFSGEAKKVKLSGILHSGINDTKTVYEQELLLKAGRSSFKFDFNVGPESFGRAIEIKLEDENGKILAQGREFFQANKEFMRVMLHGTSRYQNVFHLFGHEQSDFGIQDTDDQIYFSNERRKMNKKRLIKEVQQHRKNSAHVSFYQNRSFSGQVGLEEVRKHPEYILYGENGQPEIDPFYGGIPDPFAIASPGELEPVRRKQVLDGKDFLDVKLSACHSFIADFANLECVAYGAKSIREYQKKRGGLDIVYLDDTPSVMPGYTFEGKYNVAGFSKKQLAKLNADIARVWNSELRKDNPNAGSWCNGANPNGIRWYRSIGMWERTMGMGVDVESGIDVSDEYIRELTSVYNSMFLSEIQHSFNEKSLIKERNVNFWMKHMLEQRDYIVQKYKGSIIFGYICIDVDPDLSKLPRDLYWITLSYFHALTLATQHHHAILCIAPGIEAMQPFDQFMTRYSGLLWDKELIALSPKQAEETVKVDSKAKLLYKDFVYTRKYDDSDAMIIHFVRPYPLEKWDLKWTVPPSTLSDVKVSITIPEGKTPVLVKAMRPYDVHEKDEVVEQIVSFNVEGNQLTCTLPPFAYYNMLAVKFQ